MLFMGEGDVVAYLNKLKMVAKLQKIEDITTLIPMYLEENVLMVYLEMKEKEQVDAESIEKRLKTSFLEDAFEAYYLDWGASGRVHSRNKVTSRIGWIHMTKLQEDCQNGLHEQFSWPHLDGTATIGQD